MVISLNWIALLVIIATATGLLLSRNWRWSLGLLAVQYLGVFWMISTHWPISMAAAKIVTGWMACAVLGIAELNTSENNNSGIALPRRQLFQIITTGMVLVVTFAMASKIVSWLGLSLPIAWGGPVLIGLGLLHLGITSDAFQVVIGLLTLLAGFDILYTAVESSALVTALLMVVNLGLALTGAYFLSILQEDVS
jgi:hypothetical protein